MTQNGPSNSSIATRLRSHLDQIMLPNIDSLIRNEAVSLFSDDKKEIKKFSNDTKKILKNPLQESNPGQNSIIENLNPIKNLSLFQLLRIAYNRFFTLYGPIVYTLDILRLTLPWPIYCFLRRLIDRFFELFTVIGFWIGLDERRLMGNWRDFSLYQPFSSGDWTNQRYRYATQAGYATGFNQWNNLSGSYDNAYGSGYGSGYGTGYGQSMNDPYATSNSQYNAYNDNPGNSSFTSPFDPQIDQFDKSNSRLI